MTTADEAFNAAVYFVDRHVAEGRGTAIAIECEGRRVSYAALNEGVNRTGSALRNELGVRPEDRVLLLMLDGPEMVFAFFGAIKIGAVPIPTNTLWTPADYDFVLRDSRASVVIVSAPLHPRIVDVVPRCPWVRHVVVVGGAGDDRSIEFAALLGRASPDLEAEPTHRDAPAFWLYSSGSTGRPKGCVHLQHDMQVCAEGYARGVLDMDASDRCFSVAKLFFAYGLGNAMYFPLAVGATTILWPGPVTPPVVYDLIERYRPTLFFSVPTHYAMLLAHRDDSREFDLSSIRCAVSAGESLPPAIFTRFAERFGVEILDGIGSTEVLHIFISNRRGEARPGSSGVPVPGYEAKLVDEIGTAVAVGEIGSLLVKGDSTCAYYWNRHEQTKATIEGHWIRTGDHYYQDADGYYWCAGRSDDMLKVGGLWVSPAELEHTLLEHPSVLACGVVGRPDQDGLTKPLAYVVSRPGIEQTSELAAELQQFARTRLAEYKRPRWVEFVDALPTTATGKVQRFKLRERTARDQEV
ncbi:MAG TPA: benzoate-CoA ligase family protein [Vicinamibacterales bacterium]|nr:benzoate-CoA ligase family protein [Vicinamibacterales bacterium]